MQRSDSVQGLDIKNSLISPKATARTRNQTTLMSPAMSISDYTGANKTAVGMTSYKTPKAGLVLARSLLGKVSKSKNISFVENIMTM